jgi:hypothetical protein
MSKSLSDFTPDEQAAWSEHPITLAVVAALRGHLAAEAELYLRGAESADEKELRAKAGYLRGIKDAIQTIGGSR